MRTHVRWMIRRDLQQVLALSEDWEEQDFLEALRCLHIIGMVAEVGDEIVGLMVYRLHQDKIELLNIATAPGRRRQGFGTALLDKLMHKVCSHDRELLAVDVPAESMGAQLFFKRCGLTATGLGPDDTYRMVYRPTDCQRESFGFEKPRRTTNAV